MGRPAQEVAPVREQGADRRRAGSSTRARERLDEFYRDLPGDGGPGRVPDPRRVRLPRRVGRVRARPAARGCCSPSSPTARRVATLFLVRAGSRVVEPYGGMTEAGADSRANYLLKWEAIRELDASRAPRRYDLWGLAHAGIAHFKTGLRRPRDPVRRGVGPRARRARAADVRGRPAGARPGGAAAPRPAGRRVGVGVRRRTRAATPTGATRDRRPAVRELDGEALDGWDARRSTPRAGTSCSRGPGPSIARRAGWRPRFLAVGDARALVLVRPWPGVGGGSAYVPRGPVRRRARRGRRRRPTGVAASARRWPRSPATSPTAASTCSPRTPRSRPATPATARALDGAGFHAIPEIQPSRHRMALPLPAGGGRDGRDGRHRQGDPAADPARRARRRRRRCAGTRADGASSRAPSARPRTAPRRPATGSTASCARRATGAASGSPAPRSSWPGGAGRSPPATSSTSRRARARRTATCSAGSSCTATGGASRRPHSGDRAERRRDHPGAMHLLRWRAIELALAEGRDGDGPRRRGRRRARGGSRAEGEPTYGLYEHKRSFGAEWVALAGAQERVARPWRYAAGPRDVAGWPARWARADRRDDRPTTADARSSGSSRPPSPPSRGRSRACSPGSTPPASSAAPGATTCRSAPAALRRRRGPRRRPRTRARSRTGRCSSRCPGFHVDGTRVRRPAPPTPAPPRRIVERPVPATPLPQLVVRPRRGRARPAPRPGGTATRRGGSASSGSPARTARRRPRSSPSPRSRPRACRTGPDRHGRDEGRRRPRAPRGARDDARRARSSRRRSRAMVAAGNAAAVLETTSHALALDRVARGRLRRGDVHQPHPRAPRPPRHVRGATGRRSCGCSRALAAGDAATPRKTVAGRAVAQARGHQPRRPGRRRGSRRPPARPGATVADLRHGRRRRTCGRPRVEEDARRLRVGVRGAVRARARSSCGSPAGSTSTTRSRSSRWARASGLDPAAVRAGLEARRGRPGPDGADRRRASRSR